MAETPIAAAFTATLEGWRDKRGRFTAATENARHSVASIAHSIAADVRKLAQEESPVGKHPFGVPDGSQRFKDSWETAFTEMPDGARLTLRNKSEHAGFVMFSTRPHVIAPKRKHVLRFMGSDGQVHFSRSPVHHPGTAGNPVLERVHQKSQPVIERELQKVTRDVMTEIQHIFG